MEEKEQPGTTVTQPPDPLEKQREMLVATLVDGGILRYGHIHLPKLTSFHIIECAKYLGAKICADNTAGSLYVTAPNKPHPKALASNIASDFRHFNTKQVDQTKEKPVVLAMITVPKNTMSLERYIPTMKQVPTIIACITNISEKTELVIPDRPNIKILTILHAPTASAQSPFETKRS